MKDKSLGFVIIFLIAILIATLFRLPLQLILWLILFILALAVLSGIVFLSIRLWRLWSWTNARGVKGVGKVLKKIGGAIGLSIIAFMVATIIGIVIAIFKAYAMDAHNPQLYQKLFGPDVGFYFKWLILEGIRAGIVAATLNFLGSLYFFFFK